MTNTFRLDGDSEAVVSDAYNLLQKEIGDVVIDSHSPLNTGHHPQSSTALDIVTTSSINEFRTVLDSYRYDVTVTDPVDEQSE